MKDDNAANNGEIIPVPSLVFTEIYRLVDEKVDAVVQDDKVVFHSGIFKIIKQGERWKNINAEAEDDFSFNEYVNSLRTDEEALKAFDAYRTHLTNIAEFQAEIPDFENLVFHINNMMTFINDSELFYDKKAFEELSLDAKSIVKAIISHHEVERDEENTKYNLNQLAHIEFNRGLFYNNKNFYQESLDVLSTIKSKMLYDSIDANLEGLIHHELASSTPYGENFHHYESSMKCYEEALRLEETPITEFVQNYIDVVNEYSGQLGANFNKKEAIQKDAQQYISFLANKKPENNYLHSFIEEIGRDDEDVELEF